MEAVKVTKGKKFIQKGERIKNLFVLVQGSVRANYRTEYWDIENGSIIGLLECYSDTYKCEYTALTDCTMYAYSYTEPQDFLKIFSADPKYVSVFVMASMRQTAFFMKKYKDYYDSAKSYYSFLMKTHQEYEHLSENYSRVSHPFKRIELAEPFVSEDEINSCMIGFYEKMAGMSLKEIETFFKRDIQLGIGEILNGIEWMNRALSQIVEIGTYLTTQKDLLISANEDNLYQRFFELTVKVSSEGTDIMSLQQVLTKMTEYVKKSKIYPEENIKNILNRYETYNFSGGDGENSDIWEETAEEEDLFQIDFLDQILTFAGYESEKGKEFREDIQELKDMTDVYATDDKARVLRRRLTKAFFEVYILAFKKSLNNQNVPKGVKMFLNFGFVDGELAGENATKSLYDLVGNLSVCRTRNVYTIYDWLVSIYKGENEPCRNEFDLDYHGYLNEMKKSGRMTVKQIQEVLNDRWKKVEFEIENMFMTTNRLTYGKISSYCPLLCEFDIINSVENMLVTAEKVNEAINHIRTIDFSIFYRKVVFSDPQRDINMEMIQKEVLPNIILMPNAGSRAMMWQETAGIKRDTPARFMFPILTLANVEELMTDVAGRYRWEICRKIQGARWNDITDPSLTSEYSDYIQYYRKNHDLSPEAKEKIKNSIYKAKNNYREVFVKDYHNWINYECKGSFRLNKVSRDLLFRYCPFSRGIREKLKINPMYQELFEKYQIRTERTKRRIDLLYDRYIKRGGEITKQLQDNRDFYEL